MKRLAAVAGLTLGLAFPVLGQHPVAHGGGVPATRDRSPWLLRLPVGREPPSNRRSSGLSRDAFNTSVWISRQTGITCPNSVRASLIRYYPPDPYGASAPMVALTAAIIIGSGVHWRGGLYPYGSYSYYYSGYPLLTGYIDPWPFPPTITAPPTGTGQTNPPPMTAIAPYAN